MCVAACAATGESCIQPRPVSLHVSAANMFRETSNSDHGYRQRQSISGCAARPAWRASRPISLACARPPPGCVAPRPAMARPALARGAAHTVSTVETAGRDPIGEPDPIHRNYSLSVPLRLGKNARCHRRRHDPAQPVAAPPRIARFRRRARCAGNAPDDGARLAGRAHDNRYKKLDIPEISQ
ncbi:hypothetical protein L810_8731 [Burkholderia sp. AU4i]|nr:hypothetical protein L810_8731 [Burkholderia sp. AU4i]